VVHSSTECKFWLQIPPSVDEARPARCPACEGAAREPGRALAIVGHGRRDRQLRGPADADAEPSVLVVQARRYACLRCGAILTVVPREIQPRRHYSRPAIALALARLGLLGETAASIRRAISPWRITATAGWSTLGRWIAAVARGALFPAASLAAAATPAAQAARVAQLALGHAPPSVRGSPMLTQVFAGAVAMA
jgi:hypothetical protein